MSELIGLINVVIDLMKHMEWHGVSLWFVVQMMITMNLLVWPLVVGFFRMFFGGGGDD